MTKGPDAAAWADIAVMHAPQLLRMATMLTGSRADAEDLLQATLLRAGRHSGRILAMDAPAAYLRRMIINEHMTSGRRRSRSVVASQPVKEGRIPHTGALTAAVDQRDECWRWLAQLPAKQRAVLVLRYYEDLPDAEIAELLSVPQSTVRSHARRGLIALRSHLDEEKVQ